MRMTEQKQVRLHTYWQILHAVANGPGKKAQEIADMLGTTATTVKRIVRKYNIQGADFDKTLQWGGRRQATSFMSLEQEARMMKQLQSKALKGAVLTFRDIKDVVESKLGGSVSNDYIWDLFRRHGWSKKAPRPKHPKQDIEAQEKFKKNFRGYWQPATAGE
jgi:transposase